MYMYAYQIMCIEFSGFLSEHFCVINGVRCKGGGGGGGLSPTLLAVYLDCLFHCYINNTLWCHIRHMYTGAFLFADDIVLMAPTKCDYMLYYI